MHKDVLMGLPYAPMFHGIGIKRIILLIYKGQGRAI